MTMATLDIVLPCYNPADGWAHAIRESLEKIQAALTGTVVRLILVNDGSTKNVAKDLELLKEKFPSLLIESYTPNKGKGFAVRAGVARSTADFVIYTDIDFPYEENGLLSMYAALRDNQCDVALATRDENYYENVPPARKFISKFLKTIIRHTLKMPTADTQAGLKGFNKKGKEVFLKTQINRYLFDLEFVWMASKQKNLRISCIPAQIKKDVRFRKMPFSILIREMLNFLQILLRSF